MRFLFVSIITFFLIIRLNASPIVNATWLSQNLCKENIKLINQQENINKLMKMKGYEYRNKVTNENDKGVIAQQLESIVPEIVDSKDKYKGVKYNNIIPMLIEGIKYQQKEIEELKKQIKKSHLYLVVQLQLDLER